MIITKYQFILKDHAHAALMLELCLMGFRFTTLDSLFLVRHGGIREEEEKSPLKEMGGKKGERNMDKSVDRSPFLILA